LRADLDDLKTTNDTLGHEAGDELLRAAGAATAAGRPPGRRSGRHGGDEFVVVLFGAATPDELLALVDRLLVLLAEPVVIAETTTPIRASVGLVEIFGPADGSRTRR
jgi:diguanylate cyclase (GGDEF)-like protein